MLADADARRDQMQPKPENWTSGLRNRYGELYELTAEYNRLLFSWPDIFEFWRGWSKTTWATKWTLTKGTALRLGWKSTFPGIFNTRKEASQLTASTGRIIYSMDYSPRTNEVYQPRCITWLQPVVLVTEMLFDKQLPTRCSYIFSVVVYRNRFRAGQSPSYPGYGLTCSWTGSLFLKLSLPHKFNNGLSD